MSVEEIGTLHQRYIELSTRFKSAWTFHQFLQGLHKLHMEGELAQHSAEFHVTYGLLKEVSSNLAAATTDRVRNELEMVARRVQELNHWLVEEDTRVSPSLMRMFFQRVRNQNESIILQLAKFYLFIRPQVEWSQDHNDKVDFLITRLAEEAPGPQGPWTLRSRSQVRQTLAGLWQLVGGREVPVEEIVALSTEVASFQRRIVETESFDELIEHRLIHQYRDRKLELGELFFHPDVLLATIETNLALRNHIQNLYRREEQKIVADYQRIFELEQQVPVDQQLDLELGSFRQQVESFEHSLQNESMSLDELGRVREHVRSLIPRLVRLQESQGLSVDPEPPTRASGPAAEVSVGGGDLVEEVDQDLLENHQAALFRALEGIGEEVSPKLAAVSPALFPFRLEPREVVAFRRLGRAEAEGETELEELILRVAALRARLTEEGEETRGILDDTSVTRDAPVFRRARETLRHADRYLRRLEHEVDAEILEGRLEEARQLQILRMRLMHEMSGVWLLVHRS